MEDVQGFARIETAQVRRIVHGLKELEGVPSLADVRAAAAAAAEIEGVDKLVVPFATAFSQLAEETKRPSHELAAEIAKQVVDSGQVEFDAERFADNLQEVMVHIPAMARSAKASKLKRATGRRLESAHVFCDLRPMFDHAGKAIEGFVSIVTLQLKLEDEGPDIEVQLTPEQLDELEHVLARAKAKIAAMDVAGKQWFGVTGRKP